MQKSFAVLRIGLKIAVAAFALGLASLTAIYLYLLPQLPSIEGLSDIQLQVPLRIYSAEGALISEYGEKRRTPKVLDDMPVLLKQAFLAAEDDRFYEHPGVDYQGILRAVVHMIKTGDRGQGGSTITMQLARNFYLTSEKTYARKLNEIFLAMKIEQALSKDRILELYLNKIYLGNRAYGVSAASRVYYGKELEELDIAQMAMIAGLPKAPSRYNPVINPDRALTRRNYVLNRMLLLGFIKEPEYRWARAQPVSAGLHDSPVEVSAQYVAEMVRAEISQQFGDEAYNRGLKVLTTIDGRLQKAANQSFRQSLLAYDQRHGYRGPADHIELSEGDTADDWEKLLSVKNTYGNLIPALVIEVNEQDVRVYMKGGRLIGLDWDALSWARRYIDVNTQGSVPETAGEVVIAGDIVYVYRDIDSHWRLGQIPEVQGALVSLVPNDGAIKALVGGFDFYSSKFNRAVQAKRQAGSSFKPFIYTAALEKGYTAASIINDAPVVFHDPALEGMWRPENYSGKFFGPTRLREALTKSRNLVSIRLLRSIGIRYAVKFASRFGFDSRFLPYDLSLSLGSCELSPLELSTGFAAFANGGYRIKPYFIKRIEDADCNVLFEAEPDVACVSCVIQEKQAVTLPVESETKEILEKKIHGSEEAIDDSLIAEVSLDSVLPKQAEKIVDERTIYIMNSILRDVVNRGTARRARALGRNDLAGKTGTTNDQKDAWFNGFNHALVATAWVGFDEQQRSLGNHETGSKAALPMWIDFMRTALRGIPEKTIERPENLATVRINSKTGKLASEDDVNAIFETFRSEFAPTQKVAPGMMSRDSGSGSEEIIPEQLF
ncbi:MAG: penicillin-binding protein 1A [Gammaproteobacteria bacterium]|nr:penicillin-binding protein 1A [Gammaproteobacteria bacterium]